MNLLSFFSLRHFAIFDIGLVWRACILSMDLNGQNFFCQHTEIIQAVFETYIRVIKLAAESILLPVVLEGLAR